MRSREAAEVARAALGDAQDGAMVEVPAEVLRTLVEDSDDYRLLQVWRVGVERAKGMGGKAA